MSDWLELVGGQPLILAGGGETLNLPDTERPVTERGVPGISPHSPIGESPWGEPWLGKGFSLNDLEYATEMVATSRQHGTVTVSWKAPGGEYSRLALVRSLYGIPVHYEDGVVLAEWDMVNDPHNTYTDSTIDHARFVYYSLMALTTDGEPRWAFTAGVEALVIGDYGSHGELFRALPEHYLIDDDVRGGGNGALQRFLRMISIEVDRSKSLVDVGLRSVNNVSRISGAKLTDVATKLGAENKELIGQTRMRSLLAHTLDIRKRSGSAQSIEDLVSSITGWPTSVVAGANLLLTHDTGAFAGSLGTWEDADGAELEHTTSASPGGRTSGGYMKVTLDGGEFSFLSAPPASALDLGVPVSQGRYYTASTYVNSSDAVDVSLGIVWFDRSGTELGTSTGATVASPADSWDDRAWVSAAAPAGAYRAVLEVSGEGSTGDVFYLDDCMLHTSFELGAGSLVPYESPKKVWIYVTPLRTNLHPNPAFRSPVAPGITGPGAAAIEFEGGDVGPSQLRLSGTGDGEVSVDLGTYQVAPGEWLVASVASAGISRKKMTITWVNPLSGTQTVSGSWASGSVGWRRHAWVSSRAPEGAASAIVRLVVDATDGAEDLVREVLVEKGSVVLPWFDGDSGGGSGGHWDEYRWQGDPNDSPSLFWMHRSIRWPIVSRALADVIPHGFDHEIVFSAVPDPDHILDDAAGWWRAATYDGGSVIPNLGTAGNTYDAAAGAGAPEHLVPAGAAFVRLPGTAGNYIAADLNDGYVTITFADSSASQQVFSGAPVEIDNAGEIESIIVREGSHVGETIAEFIADDMTDGYSVVDDYDVAWTLHRSDVGDVATLVDRPLWRFGEDDFLTIPHGPVTDMPDEATICIAARFQVGGAHLLNKIGPNASDMGFEVTVTDEFEPRAHLSDGAIDASAEGPVITPNQWTTISIVRKRSSHYLTVWVDNHPRSYVSSLGPIGEVAFGEPWNFGSIDNTGDLTNLLDLIVGQDEDGGWEISEMAIFLRALSPAEISRVTLEFSTLE